MPEVTVSGHRFKVTPMMVVATVLAILALVFSGQNTTETRVHLLFWNLDRPAWVWLLVLFVAGFLVRSFLPWFRHAGRTNPVGSHRPAGPGDHTSSDV
jgi:uncharacterized integral membrane protein